MSFSFFVTTQQKMQAFLCFRCSKIWFFARLIVTLASPKLLTLEITQIKFGFLLA